MKTINQRLDDLHEFTRLFLELISQPETQPRLLGSMASELDGKVNRLLDAGMESDQLTTDSAVIDQIHQSGNFPLLRHHLGSIAAEVKRLKEY